MLIGVLLYCYAQTIHSGLIKTAGVFGLDGIEPSRRAFDGRALALRRQQPRFDLKNRALADDLRLAQVAGKLCVSQPAADQFAQHCNRRSENGQGQHDLQ